MNETFFKYDYVDVTCHVTTIVYKTTDNTVEQLEILGKINKPQAIELLSENIDNFKSYMTKNTVKLTKQADYETIEQYFL